MMNARKYIVLIMILLSFSFIGWGQKGVGDTVLKGSVIEVIQAYKPQVRQAPKPEWIPQMPPADTFHRVFKYVVPQQSLFYSYHSDPLRPLALGKDTMPPPFQNFVKAGVGNLSTLFLDAGIGSMKGEDFETYLHVHHLSQKGDIHFQQTALTGLEAEGLMVKENNVWHGNIDASRNQYYYYGYDHDTYHYANADSLKQTYTWFQLSADYKRKDMGDELFDYHPVVSASVFNASMHATETGFGLLVPMTYDLDTIYQLVCSVSENFVNLKTDSPGVVNNLFKVMPGVSMRKDEVTGHAYLGLAVGKGGNMFVLPDIAGDYKVPGSQYRVTGGWMASVNQNTYHDLTNDNPYISSNYLLHQTRTDELYAGIQGDFRQLQLFGKLSWCNFKSLPVYLDTVGDRKQFNVLYDTVSAISIQLGGRYLLSDKYEAGLNARYYKYYQGTSQYPWNLPDMNIKADFACKPIHGLVITSYLEVLSGVHSIDNSGKIISLKTVCDLGLNGEYSFNSRAAAFLQISNLLNQHYERWMGYESYGINIYGGFRLKF